jgi:hypothetical protein
LGVPGEQKKRNPRKFIQAGSISLFTAGSLFGISLSSLLFGSFLSLVAFVQLDTTKNGDSGTGENQQVLGREETFLVLIANGVILAVAIVVVHVVFHDACVFFVKQIVNYF